MSRKPFEIVSTNNLVSVLVIFAGFLGAAFFARGYIDNRIHAFMLEHPGAVADAAKAGERSNNDAAVKIAFARLTRERGASLVAAYRPTIVRAPAGSAAGWTPADMSRTLMVFTDYNCAFCRADIADLQALETSNKFDYVFHFEAPILAKESRDTARLSLALAELGLFKKAYPWPYKHAREDKNTAIAALARELHISPARVVAAMQSPVVARILKAHEKLVADLSIAGTPTYVLGGKVYVGSLGSRHKDA
jgi:protein-disulfide isomerase